MKAFARCVAAVAALAFFGTSHAQVPNLITYQGRVVVGATNFNSPPNGLFKFALVNAAGTTTYWSNDGTSAAGSQPTNAVSLTVTKGLYSVLLGDTTVPGMTQAIPVSVWANADVRLRVWFNDGTHGSQLLTPDQRLAPTGYLPAGSVSSAKLASGLTLGGTTTGTFSGNLSGNATTATTATSATTAGSATNFTGNLAGNVTGPQGATIVATVGGVTASNVATGANLANAATNANTANTIVKRNASGSFSGNLSGNATTATNATSATSAGSATNFTGNLAGNVTGPQGATAVATVGGVTATNVATGANLANAATNANTANKIVKRDALGNFSAGSISAASEDAVALSGVEAAGAFNGSNIGVLGESMTPNGNGVVGVADNGTAAYAIWGQSSSGFAGYFDGTVRVTKVAGTSAPALEVLAPVDAEIGIRSMSSSGRLWTIQSSGTYGSPALDGTFQIIDRTPGAGLVGLKILPSGTVSVKVLQINGADVAEPFDIATKDAAKGAVVVIDEENPGRLKVSDHAYDRRVAGILSGANGVRSGIRLSQEGFNEGGQDVALSGRVYVQADASNGAIEPGDLLTTSDVPGCAMKVTDSVRAQGAVLGKAMSPLARGGRGNVLVLVTLQ